jgi:hypothetical protein
VSEKGADYFADFFGTALSVYVWVGTKGFMVTMAHSPDEARIKLLRKYDYLDTNWLLEEPTVMDEAQAYYISTER